MGKHGLWARCFCEIAWHALEPDPRQDPGREHERERDTGHDRDRVPASGHEREQAPAPEPGREHPAGPAYPYTTRRIFGTTPAPAPARP